MGGFKGWLIRLVVTELYEEIGEPIIKYALNEVGYQYDKVKGRVIVRRIEKARNENNPDGYNSAVDSSFKY